MTEHIKDEDQWRQPNDPLTKTGSLAFASLPADTSLLDHSVRQIKCQMISDQVFDLIRGKQQAPDLLETTLAALDADCRSAFLRQIAKRIEGSR
jgi:hypothetical protein